MSAPLTYPPTEINSGPWVVAYTLERLRRLPSESEFLLPIVPLGAPLSEVARMGSWLLPPLYAEAMTDSLRKRIVDRIVECFPHYGDATANRRRVRVVEMRDWTPAHADASEKALAFSVDTAVEEHGPHLPLATDTIQSYSVLEALRERFDALEIVNPVDYGQLTWGLPFGFSVDLTCELLTEYVSGFAKALVAVRRPQALYVVDVHGAATHRQAVVDGLCALQNVSWTFRWLHEPLAEFASARGDQHAGGVETALVERVGPQLIDTLWWPSRRDDIAAGQMSFDEAVALTPDLDAFQQAVAQRNYNGVIGDIRNYDRLDRDELFERMLDVATSDVVKLLSGAEPGSADAGPSLW